MALKPKSQRTKKVPKIYGFDIETCDDNKTFLMASLYTEGEEPEVMYSAENTISELMKQKYCNAIICATNLSFDFFGTFFKEKELMDFRLLARGSDLLLAKSYVYKGKFVPKLPKGEEKKKAWRVLFVDTFNYVKMSVNKMGGILKKSKLKKPEFLGERPISVEEWDELIAYNIRDSEISHDFLKFLLKGFIELGADVKYTIASTAMSLFRNKYLKDTYYIHDDEVLREQFKCYYGGRTEAFGRGYFSARGDRSNVDELYYYDLNSLYPFCMKEYVYPDINSLRMNHNNTIEYIKKYEGCAKVDLYCPEMMYPYLPYRMKSKLLFPVGNFSGWYTNVDIREAMKLGYVVKKVYKTYYYKDVCRPFKDYVESLYNLRLKYKAEGSPMEKVVKLLMNCFSYDTDIMTEEGLKNIKDVKKGDLVYSINPKTLDIEMKKVIRTFKYKHDGKMIHFDTGICDFLVTDNHKFLVKKKWDKENNFDFIEAKDVYEHTLPRFKKIKGVRDDVIDLRRYIRKDEKIIKVYGGELWRPNNSKYKANGVLFKFHIRDMMRVMGYYLSDGNQERGTSRGIRIAKKRLDQRDEVEKGISDLGVRYYKDKNGFRIYHRLIADFLLDECKEYAGKKRIPSWVFKYDYSVLQILYDAMMLCDGYSDDITSTGNHQSHKYSTKSKGMAEDFQRLCVHLGKKTKIKQDSGIYRVYVYRVKNNHLDKRKGQIKETINNSNHVYSVEVEDNHTVLAGRNGTTQFVGQSQYGKWGEKYFSRENVIPANLTISEITKINRDGGIITLINDQFMRIKTEFGRRQAHSIPIWASYVTSYGRREIYKYISKYHPEYCDTDSVVTRVPMSTGKQLGEMKLEMELSEAIFVRPKFYGMVNADPKAKQRDIVKIKGVPILLMMGELRHMMTNSKERIIRDENGDIRARIKNVDGKALVEYRKFTKFLEGVNRGIQPNVIQDTHKALSLEDEKRCWEAPFSLEGYQRSIPVKVNGEEIIRSSSTLRQMENNLKKKEFLMSMGVVSDEQRFIHD